MAHRWLLVLTALVLVPPGCKGSPPARATSTEGLEIDYRVEGGRSKEELELRFGAEGLTRLTLRRPLRTEPAGAVGFFAVRPTTEERKAILDLVSRHRLLERRDEAEFTADATGHLRVVHGGKTGELSLFAKDEGKHELELRLRGLLERARARPLAAVQLVSKARMDGPNAVVDVALVHRGTKPVELALHQPGEPEGVLELRVVFERAGRLADELILARKDVERLVARGKLPGGWHSLAPGGKVHVPLPLVRLPPAPHEVALRVEAAVLARSGGNSVVLLPASAPAPLEPEQPAEP
jgi:hypothetical protein